MSGFLDFVLSPLSPATLRELLQALPQILASLDAYMWMVVLLIIGRFQLPTLIVWVISAVAPRHWYRHARPDARLEKALVSVLIAGRNEEDTIQATIGSVLRSTHKNLEVIFVDDCSTDRTLERARAMMRMGSVKTFGCRDHNGKPTCLNIALSMARGDFLMIVDADSEIEPDAIADVLARFSDPNVGAVAANIGVRNPDASLATRLQELEYALNVTISRLWRAEVGMLGIVPGAAGMFRASAVRAMKGFDTGLGDDTDMTLKLRKQGWKLRFALGATVWTDVPETFPRLFRQRRRWERNMVKIRLRKHGGMLLPWRHGWTNTLMTLDNMFLRIVMPALAISGAVSLYATSPFSAPVLITHLYWMVAAFSLVKLVIARDISGFPRWRNIALVPLMPVYRLVLRLVIYTGILQEILRIKLRHGYVPEKIWRQTPHW